MRGIYRLLLLAAALSVFASAGPAFALPKCTPHDRLIQKVDASYKTQFQTNCTTPGTTVQTVR